MIEMRKRISFVFVFLLFTQVQSALSNEESLNFNTFNPNALRALLPQTFSTEPPSVIAYTGDYTLDSKIIFRAISQANSASKVTAIQGPQMAIYLSKGYYRLNQIFLAVNNAEYLSLDSRGEYVLSVPIIIREGAGLVLDNDVLKLNAEQGTFLLNSGELYVYDSTIQSWDIELQQPKQLKYRNKAVPWLERGFILNEGAASVFLVNSLFSHLGQPGFAFSHGISFQGKNPNQDVDALSIERLYQVSGKPKGVIAGNTVENGYKGMNFNNVQSTLILGNVFRHSVSDNVSVKNVHDTVQISRNVFVGSRYGDGLYVSSIQQVELLYNLMANNAGDGVNLFRIGDRSLVENNVFLSNAKSGLFAKENNALIGKNNIAIGNARSGIRVRDNNSVRMSSGRFAQNGYYGIELESVFDTENTNIPTQLNFSQVDLLDNQFDENFDSALSVKGQTKLWMHGNEFSGLGGTSFGGLLTPHTADILQQNSSEAGYIFCNGKEEYCQ